MAENRTEEATAHRRVTAREKGQVMRSRELTSAATLMFSILAVSWLGASWLAPWRHLFSLALEAGNPAREISTAILFKTAFAVAFAAAPIMWIAFGIATGVSFGQGGFNLSTEALMPNFDRLNPATNAGKLFSAKSVIPLLRSIFPASYIGWLGFSVLRRDWQSIIHASHYGLPGMVHALTGEAYEVAWKSAMVLLVWAGVDYGMQKYQFEESLKMSKQEVKEEGKNLNGNPAVKGRIRGLQRQLRRKIMMKMLEKATVVITNPTHYAVAIEYTENMDAPIVVAKGRNLIAQQIKEKARWAGIPIVENRPLAQSLYKTVEPGQAIPPQLYTAVAEILAFIYRAQAMAAAAAAAAARSRNTTGGRRI